MNKFTATLVFVGLIPVVLPIGLIVLVCAACCRLMDTWHEALEVLKQ